MADIETVEYQKVTPKDRIDLDIEDVQYKRGKKEVLTERGEKLEQFKQNVTTSAPYRAVEKGAAKTGEVTKNVAAETSRQGKNTLTKFLEWRKAQIAKREALKVTAPQPKVVYRRGVKAHVPKQRIVYVNNQPQLQARGDGSLPPDVSGGMRPPDITGGGAMAPRIIDDSPSNIPRIVGDNSGVRSGGIMDSIGGGGSLFDKMSGGGQGGNAFDKLGLGGMNTKGGFLDSLKIKKKGGLW